MLDLNPAPGPVLKLPNLQIDLGAGGPDDEVLLTQDWSGDEHSVTLHPMQVRLLAERMKLLGPDAAAQRTINRLCRQLRTLEDRISTLDDWLRQVASNGRENLDNECTFSFATWELAHEFVADLPPLASSSSPADGQQVAHATDMPPHCDGICQSPPDSPPDPQATLL